jgi:hypothetical protein
MPAFLGLVCYAEGHFKAADWPAWLDLSPSFDGPSHGQLSSYFFNSSTHSLLLFQ